MSSMALNWKAATSTAESGVCPFVHYASVLMHR